MSGISLTAPLPKASRGERPFALENADHERLLNMIVALMAEVSVLLDQQDTMRRLLVAKGVVGDEEIAHFQPDSEAAAERGAKRAAFIERVMRIVLADAERAGRDDMSYEDVLAMVSRRTPA